MIALRRSSAKRHVLLAVALLGCALGVHSLGRATSPVRAMGCQVIFPRVGVEMTRDGLEFVEFAQATGCTLQLVAELRTTRLFNVLPQPCVFQQECRVSTDCVNLVWTSIPEELKAWYEQETEELRKSGYPLENGELRLGSVTRVLWSGAIWNASFLILTGGAAAFLLRGLREHRINSMELKRAHSGLCAQCAYPVKGNRRCPECGTAPWVPVPTDSKANRSLR